MKRFINYYDSQGRYICGESYYFDQRLPNLTVICRAIDKYTKQRAAYDSNPERYIYPNNCQIKIFSGDRFEESVSLTPMIDLRPYYKKR